MKKGKIIIADANCTDCPYCSKRLTKVSLFRHMLDVHKDILAAVTSAAKFPSSAGVAQTIKVVVLPKSKKKSGPMEHRDLNKVAKPAKLATPSPSTIVKSSHPPKTYLLPMGTKLKSLAGNKPRKNLARITCVLCGQKINTGELLMHKVAAHGESENLRTNEIRPNLNLWVRVHQGGLPSLGKKR